MKILANPVFLRAGVVFCCATFAFLLGLIFLRLLRKSIHEEADISSEASPSLEALPMHLYNTVIQQLKQQKHELQIQSQTEQTRARTAETFSQAVLSNLSSGVLVFGTSGLVKSTNAAAKAILGFASTTGMSAADIFRGAEIRPATPDAEPVFVADEIDAVLHQGSKRRQVEAEYETPSGEQRFISVTVSPVLATEGGVLGIACLINDLSELERIRRQQEMRGAISAEMALHLRTSLTTISGYAQQLANIRDPEVAKQLAADIAEEAALLDRSIGGFLVERGASQSAGAGLGD